MIDISKYRILKYFLFFNLYASEGLIFSLSTVITVLYFNELNIPISTTTIVAGIINIPWILKFVPGPIIDHYIMRGRKPFIIFGGLTGALCLFPLALLDPTTTILPFTLFFFISHLGVVFLDVSADAWAVQISEYNERGKVNAAMNAGLFSFWALGSIILAFIGQNFGYTMTFILVGFFILLTILFPLFVKEIKIIKKHQKIKSILIKEFSKKNTLLITALEFVAPMNFGILLLVIPSYTTDFLYLDDFQTGIMSAINPISIVIGGIIGGVFSDRFGRKPIIFICFTGIILFSILLVLADTWQILAIIYAIIGLLQGSALYTALAALVMDIINPKIGATQLSILMSVHNFGDIGISMISGSLVLMLGYDRFFLYAALIVGPVLLLLYFIKDKRDEKKNIIK